VVCDRDLYRLSKKFAPPEIDLRRGRILDDGGSDKYATVLLKHRDPTEVSVPELEYYHDVWLFLTPRDLIFYLYSVLRLDRIQGKRLVYLERWLDTVDRRLEEILLILNASQTQVFRDALANVTNTVSDSLTLFEDLPKLSSFVSNHD
jgi:hypothetical protein